MTGHELFFALCEHLRTRHGIRVRVLPLDAMGDRLRWYDHHRRQLLISEVMDQPGRTFQTAYQLAFGDCDPLLNEIGSKFDPGDEAGRKLAARHARQLFRRRADHALRQSSTKRRNRRL